MFPDERETPYDNKQEEESKTAVLRCCVVVSLLQSSRFWRLVSLWDHRIEESGMILLCLAVAVESLLFLCPLT